MREPFAESETMNRRETHFRIEPIQMTEPPSRSDPQTMDRHVLCKRATKQDRNKIGKRSGFTDRIESCERVVHLDCNAVRERPNSRNGTRPPK